jgi:serine/threonine-protein kinase
MAQQLTCPNCGMLNRAGAKFCNNCATPLAISSTGRLPPNSVLQNRYVIITPLGRGGMGAVYQAADKRFSGRFWAIKEMSDAGLNPSERQRAIQDFQREANMLACLNHPNLPRVVDNFEETAKWYLVMDFIEGETLEEKLAQSASPLHQDEVIDWAIQLCDVLTYLHSQNPPLIFRDLKPSNIMREDKTGHVKLIDFGIARFFKTGQARDTAMLGTVGYAPPEQHGKGQTDARSDIYALGVTMHQLLTKYDPTTTPFNLPAPRSLNKSIPAPLEQVILTATQLDPSKRYPSAVEMQQALVSLAHAAIAPTQSASPATSFPKRQPAMVSASSTPPIPVALVVALLVITGVPGLIALGAGAIGILCAILMWFGKKWGRRIGILYLAVGSALVGICEGAAFFMAYQVYCKWNSTTHDCDYQLRFDVLGDLAGLVLALVLTLGLAALVTLLRDDVLDFFYPQHAPHLNGANRSVTIVAWAQILLGFWLVLPLVLGFGLLYHKRWALRANRILSCIGVVVSILIFLLGLALTTSSTGGFVVVLFAHLTFLISVMSLYVLTRREVDALF